MKGLIPPPLPHPYKFVRYWRQDSGRWAMFFESPIKDLYCVCNHISTVCGIVQVGLLVLDAMKEGRRKASDFLPGFRNGLQRRLKEFYGQNIWHKETWMKIKMKISPMIQQKYEWWSRKDSIWIVSTCAYSLCKRGRQGRSGICRAANRIAVSWYFHLCWGAHALLITCCDFRWTYYPHTYLPFIC